MAPHSSQINLHCTDCKGMQNVRIKFRFSEKATKIWKNLPLILMSLSKRQEMWEIFSNYSAFLQYLNFNNAEFQFIPWSHEVISQKIYFHKRFWPVEFKTQQVAFKFQFDTIFFKTLSLWFLINSEKYFLNHTYICMYL